MAKKKDKKKIKMLTAMAGLDFSYAHGEIIEVDEHIAEAWIEAQIAELVGEE
nr:hypothetical protein 2 [bacterium]